jgi:protein TonB
VRVGGRIKAPDLIHEVSPHYPRVAQAAHIHGLVILEATVGVDGHVQTVRVLRGQPFLNPAAITAVKQWVYSPLTLNGQPTPFILTVTVTFALH